MAWEIVYLNEAKAEFKRLDHSQQIQVLKAIKRVSINPLPNTEGGYGKPLGSHNSSKLTGYFKIVLMKLGIRVVYKLIREESLMRIIVISMRGDEEVYKIADERIHKK
jgi:mRNA interferase RelE/StbE